ncbi:cupin [Thalassotalea sp. 42_200_T64]|nr:cupin [Thalassotalea sp. 42_200_T64]
MTLNNIYADIPTDLSAEVFETLAGSKKVTIERIISKGHCSPAQGWHQQECHEWVIVLQGAAILTFEDDSQVTLNTGDYLNIKPLQKHKVSWTRPEQKTIWLAIHY